MNNNKLKALALSIRSIANVIENIVIDNKLSKFRDNQKAVEKAVLDLRIASNVLEKLSED